MDKETISNFEEEIARLYADKKIRAPIHLRSGNEEHLIRILNDKKEGDYFFGTWATHVPAIVWGIPLESIKKKILDGGSIALCFPDYNFYSSAIVGGCFHPAVGVALSLKMRGLDNRVWCLFGDMSSQTGDAFVAIKYSIKNDLPITWICESNGKSVMTPTEEVCIPNRKNWHVFEYLNDSKNVKLEYYEFCSKWPHSSIGRFIAF